MRYSASRIRVSLRLMASLPLLLWAPWVWSQQWECARKTPLGTCVGPAVYHFGNGDRLTGHLEQVDDRTILTGAVTYHFANGNREDCTSVGENGRCNGKATFTFAGSGTQLTGHMTDDEWQGRVYEYKADGRRRYCEAYRKLNGCTSGWVNLSERYATPGGQRGTAQSSR